MLTLLLLGLILAAIGVVVFATFASVLLGGA
jgi:hypothetical protein